MSTGSPGSATEVMAFRIIEAAGVNPMKDITRERLGVAESVNAIKDRKIDAFFWVGGLPAAAVTDQVVYNIVKTVFDKRDDLITVHRAAEEFKIGNQKPAASPVPFHPGAVKYFKEKGAKF